MLKVQCMRRLGLDSVTTDEVSLVVIEDRFGNPIAVVMETQPNVAEIISANEPDFNRILDGLGISKIVVANTIKPSHAPQQGAKLLQGPLISRKA